MVKKNRFFITQTVTVGKIAGNSDVSLWHAVKGNSNIDYNYHREKISDIKWFCLDKVSYGRSDFRI